MKAVKSKFKGVVYKYISVGVDGLQLVSDNGVVVIVPIKLEKPYSLYKIQDIEKAINLYEKSYKSGTLSIDEMLAEEGLNHLFVVDKKGNINYSKSTLHSTFGRFNKSLFSDLTDKETIFIVRNDKSIMALIKGHYYIISQGADIKRKIGNEVSRKSYQLFRLLVNELSKSDNVEGILTKIL